MANMEKYQEQLKAAGISKAEFDMETMEGLRPEALQKVVDAVVKTKEKENETYSRARQAGI